MLFTISYFPLDSIHSSVLCLLQTNCLEIELFKQMDLISRLIIGSTSALTKYEAIAQRKGTKHVQHRFKKYVHGMKSILFYFCFQFHWHPLQIKQNRTKTKYWHRPVPQEGLVWVLAPGILKVLVRCFHLDFEKTSKKPLVRFWDVMFFRISWSSKNGSVIFPLHQVGVAEGWNPTSWTCIPDSSS